MGKYKNTLLFLIVISVFWSNSAISTGSGLIPWVSSSSIFPVDESTKIYYQQNSRTSYLMVSAPNEYGISLNEFSQFDSSEPLKIVNTHRTISTADGEKDVEPAQLIVISSQEINLIDSIEILGPPTDILFISSQSNGYIACQSCSIKNSLRVSFIAGVVTEPLSSNSSEIGEIISGPTSYISIDSLTAPGLVSLDVLANEFSLTGLIDINLSASQTESGAYVSDSNGNLSIGTGSVNLLLGELTWDYDDDLIKSIGSGSDNTIEGEIHSSGVKITSAGQLYVKTLVDTRTDVLSSISYKLGTYIPSEGVDIQALNGGFNLYGKLQTTGDVNLKSAGSIGLYDSIEAKVVKVIAGKAIGNRKNITSSFIAMEGENIFNEGKLVAEEEISLLSDQHLANHFGGVIKSKTVRLSSKNQVVINGARYPYRHIGSYDDRNGQTVLGGSVGYQNLLMDSSSYIDRLDPSYLGTFYTMTYTPLTVPVTYAVTKAPDLSAHIVAESLYVKSVGFENINPYYVNANEQGNITYDVNMVDQVSISVEDYAAIDASDYFVNSSAEFEVNGQTSLFAVDTGIFINERYRTVSPVGGQVYDPCPGTGQWLGNWTKACPQDQDYFGKNAHGINITSETLANSPPGRITAFGNMEIKSADRIVNNTAYTEIYGNADFDSPHLDIFGFENEMLIRSTDADSVQITADQTCLTTSNGWLSVSGASTTTCGLTYKTQTDSIYGINFPIEGDSLFLVHGILKANTAMGWFKTHNPINGVIEEIVSQGPYASEYLVQGYDVEEIKATDQIVIEWTNGNTFGYSLIAQLKLILDGLMDAIAEFFNEFDWFDESD